MNNTQSTQTEFKNKHNNSINTISIFKKGNAWVFNDPEVDLLEEPFVAGADTLLDKIAGGADKVQVIFSHIQFPKAELTLEYIEGEVSKGTTYLCLELDHELWLCPALHRYFKNSPKNIYLQYK